MKFRDNILELTEKMDTLIDTTKSAMERHAIDADQVYKNFTEIQTGIERIRILIKNEVQD